MATDSLKSDVEEAHGKTLPAYVLVTPAWNEAEFIEETLRSMVAQTVLPLKWVIVSDGSTDGTDEIVRQYTSRYDWIELVRTPERAERHFAGKVHAFNAGWDRVKGLPYDIIGNLDADISFEQDLMEFLLARFASDTELGVAGTAFIEDGAVLYDYDIVSREDVSGQCQLFRRQCFEEIGGYTPSKIGGIRFHGSLCSRHEGMDDPHLHGKGVHPPPPGRHCPEHDLFHPLQERPEGLLPGGASAVGGVPLPLPDEEPAIRDRRAAHVRRVCVGVPPGGGTSHVAGADRIPAQGAVAAAEGNHPAPAYAPFPQHGRPHATVAGGC